MKCDKSEIKTLQWSQHKGVIFSHIHINISRDKSSQDQLTGMCPQQLWTQQIGIERNYVTFVFLIIAN